MSVVHGPGGDWWALGVGLCYAAAVLVFAALALVERRRS